MRGAAATALGLALAALTAQHCARPLPPPCVAARAGETCTEDRTLFLPALLMMFLEAPEEFADLPEAFELPPAAAPAPAPASGPAPAREARRPYLLPPPIMTPPLRYPSFVGPPPRPEPSGGPP